MEESSDKPVTFTQMDVAKIDEITNDMVNRFWHGIQKIRDDDQKRKQKKVLGSVGPLDFITNAISILQDRIAAALVTTSVNTSTITAFEQISDLGTDPVFVFVTQQDDRVCPICLPLDRVIMRRSEGTVREPPLHESCRCRLELLSSFL